MSEARDRGERAESEVSEIEGKLRSLDQDTNGAARLQSELIDLKGREAKLSEELAVQSNSLREIEVLEGRVSEVKLKLDSTKKSLELAKKAKTGRDELIESVETANKDHQQLAESSKEWISSLKRAEKELGATVCFPAGGSEEKGR